MYQQNIPAYEADRLVPFLGAGRVADFDARLRRFATALAGRRLVTVTGDDRRKGGVYEILRSTLPYLRGAGVEVVWVNLGTAPESRRALEFFHVLAHGQAPSADWQEEIEARAAEFADFTGAAAGELRSALEPSDVILLNDTQTALIPAALPRWADRLAWHAHIGTVARNGLVDRYWDVVGRGVAAAGGRIFYRAEFAPPSLREASTFASPGIDPSSAKSAWLDRDVARTRLGTRPDGPLRWLSEPPLMTGAGQVAGLQLSRWDPLKDMPGALRVFARLAERSASFVGLVVGPSAESAGESAQLQRCVDEWRATGPAVARRVHIGVIEECGSGEHDEAVRILQSAADIILQRSIQEGFGLTITEAMLRAKAVVATPVGGIPLQLSDGHNGILVTREAGVDAWADRLRALAGDRGLRLRLGANARGDVLRHHTIDRHLTAVIKCLSGLL